MMQVMQRSIPPWQATSVAKEDAVADDFAAAPSRKQLSTGSKRTYQDMDAVSTTSTCLLHTTCQPQFCSYQFLRVNTTV